MPAKSALITIDVQRDFSDPGAVAEIPGTGDRVPVMRRVVEAYRRHRLPIVHVVRLYLSDGTNVDICRRAAIEAGKAVVTPGTPGAELVTTLKPDPNGLLDSEILLSGSLQSLAENEWAMYKPRWDAFYGTPLNEHLRSLGVTTIVVVGCNFPNCPRATVHGASMRDFRAVLIADAVSGIYDQGLREANAIGIATPLAEDYLADLENAMTTRVRRDAVGV